MSYEQKYLKYKTKYLDLKNQIGGDLCPVCKREIVTGACKCQNVKITYYPMFHNGSYDQLEEKGLSREEISMIGKKRDTPIFRFNPAVLQEGVDYSYTHNPPNWSDPLEMISARGTTAILLKDMSVTFIPSEKNLGVFKKGYMFDIYQYDSKYKLIDVKNKALFRVHDIEK